MLGPVARVLACLMASSVLAALPAHEGAVAVGEPFPKLALKNLNAGTTGTATVDLAQELGRKPIVLCYWIAGNPRAEEVVRQLQELSQQLGRERLALYTVVKRQPGREADVIQARARAIGLTAPVLDDDKFQLVRALGVETVPHITLIDREGRLRLAGAGSLIQTLEYKIDVRAAIKRAAETGKVGTYGYLPRYYPVQELIGKRSPDFSAPLIGNDVERRWSALIDPRSLNVLIFWSVDCAHCRKALPEINAWLKEHATGVNVVSAAMISDAAVKAKTRAFCESNSFVFPTLVDQNLKVSEQFLVTTTPTILVVRPDGIVDSVLTSDVADFGRTMEQKKRELLNRGG